MHLAREDDFKIDVVPCRSLFRRMNYKFFKSEPKKVQFRLSVEFRKGKLWQSAIFEVNIENLGCQRVFLDDQKQLYVICQTQQVDGKKQIVVRSPMEVVNNL